MICKKFPLYGKNCFRAWDDESKEYWDWDELQEDWSYGYYDSVFREDHWVCEQFTGAYDKKDVPIYENDLVEVYTKSGRFVREGWIIYDPREMKFKIRSERCPDWNEKTEDFTFHPLKQDLLVVGNIHEGRANND